MSFFAKLANHLLNQVLVEGLANRYPCTSLWWCRARAPSGGLPFPVLLSLSCCWRAPFARSRTFQRFAVWSHKTGKELAEKGAGGHPPAQIAWRRRCMELDAPSCLVPVAAAGALQARSTARSWISMLAS
jgi:hypothetical protein